MKPPSDHDELLHALLAEAPAPGPSAEAVLDLLRTERSRRRRRRTVMGVVAGLAVLGLGVVAWLQHRQPSRLAQAAAPPPAEPFSVKRVNDQEFLDLLAQQDQPVALLRLPNGERRLLVLHAATAVDAVP